MEVNSSQKMKTKELRNFLKKMFNTPIHKKLQITTTLRFNLTQAGMVKMRKNKTNKKKQKQNNNSSKNK